MRYSIASKMHTLACTTEVIHSPELSYLYFHIRLRTFISKINNAALYITTLQLHGYYFSIYEILAGCKEIRFSSMP